MYLSRKLRPDIQFEVQQCTRFTQNTGKSHAEAVKIIWRYLVEKQGQGLTFNHKNDMNLECYVDTDFAGLWKHEDGQDTVRVKSRTGHVMTVGVCLLYWISNFQTSIAL